MKFKTKKLYEGFSCCFRQWRAEGTHCKFLHGYGVSFEITFEGELDERNWVADFGLMKRSKVLIDGKSPDEYFKWLFDHTTIIAEDDPHRSKFELLNQQGIIQLRVLPKVGCEMFAKKILTDINEVLYLETKGRVVASEVRFFENNKNSAIAVKEVFYVNQK